MDSAWVLPSEDLEDTKSTLKNTRKSSPKSVKNADEYVKETTIYSNESEDEKCDCRITILPYYGLVDTQDCTVRKILLWIAISYEKIDH